MNEINSIKRSLSIVEKVFIIFFAFISYPVGLAISNFFVREINPFSIINFSTLSIGWVITFLLLIFLEFYFKNVSLYKGIFKSTVISALLCFTITFSILCVYIAIGTYPLNYVIFASFIGLTYIVLLTFIRILLIYLNSRNTKIALIIGPKEDANLLAKKLIKENYKKIKVKYIFYEIDEHIDDNVFLKFKECNSIILLNSLSFKNKQKFLLYFNSNLNKDSITAISHPGPDQLIYDNQFEISSLTPNVNVEFFIYHRDKIDGEYRVIKKRIKPVSLCIVIGLYEDF